MLEKGCHFLVRVGGNVNLLTEMADCSLDKSTMIVLSWPEEARNSGKPPLRLRLLKVRVGKTWMWLLTSVLDKKKLNVTQIREIDKHRWEIEVEFRGLKQTLDKGELRCRNAARVKAELHWSLMGMAIAELFALKEQLAVKQHVREHELPVPVVSLKSTPQKRSLAETVGALRWSLTHLKDIPRAGETLPEKLQQAQTDNYERKSPKAARYRPPNPDKTPLGNPKIRRLTPQEKIKFKAIKDSLLPL